MREFDYYLASKDEPPSGLTDDNFTLSSKPLGLKDSSKEIIRQAARKENFNKVSNIFV